MVPARQENRRIVRARRLKRIGLTSGPVPRRKRGEILFRSLLTGVDGTDEEVARRLRVELPQGKPELVLGHEALAEVVDSEHAVGRLRPGDRVVPLVREGCNACRPCKSGVVDMCASGDYDEHGIRRLDGFMQDFWTDRADHVVRVPDSLGSWAVLVEPLSIVVKALEHARQAQHRLSWFDGFDDAKGLVVGSGSLGSMAGLLLVQGGIVTSALDRHGPKAASTRLWRRVDVEHIRSDKRSPRPSREDLFDIVIETTGVPKVIVDAAQRLAPNGIMVLLGIPRDPKGQIEIPSALLQRFVQRNQVVVGSVNSNRGHFEEAIRVLSKMRRRDPSLFELIVTHRFRPEETKAAFETNDESVVKKIIEWSGDA